MATAAGSARASDVNRRSVVLAGILLFVGTAWISIAITVAESLTSGYSVSSEAISGLGVPYFSGVCWQIPRCGSPVQPASAIFVSALLLNGLLQLWAGLLLRRASGHRRFGLGFAVVGAGTMLVGVSYFPFYLGATTEGIVGAALLLHVVGALLVFLLTPILAISSFRFLQKPLRHFSVLLGVISLAAAILYFTNATLGLGSGGMERMIAYPLFLWQIGFSVYLFRGLE